MPIHSTKLKRHALNIPKMVLLWFWPFGIPKKRLARRLFYGFWITLAVVITGMYGIATWYRYSNNDRVQLGVSFIPDYATYLGVDPHETLDSLLNIGVKHFRYVSYWSDIEPTPGNYNFSELDYEMAAANSNGAKVTLAIGLRQPRWPECHPPNWADTSLPESTWRPQLNKYITAVVDRYKDNPAIESYQLENEFYNHFGTCKNFNRQRLNDELALVHNLDNRHPVIISRSDNYTGFSLRRPLPDIIGISVYRRVWDGTLTHRYLQYPFPAWYYSFLAGSQQILTGKPSVLHELQTEAWPPRGQDIKSTSLSEQNKSFDAKRMQNVIKFGKSTGLDTVDLWGAEYWYYRQKVLNDPSLWNVAEKTFGQN